MKHKKAISPVVATALLLVISVISAVSFQNWAETYSTTTFINIEQQSEINNLDIVNIIDDILYLKSGIDENLILFKIIDENNNELCNYKKGYTNKNLISYWDFDNRNTTHIFDNSEYNNHGEMKNNPLISKGIFGESILFNKTNQNYVEFNENLRFNEQRTFSGWINYKEYVGNSSRLFTFRDDNSKEVFSLRINKETGYPRIIGNLDFTSNWTDHTVFGTTNITKYADNWIFVSFIQNDSNLTLYIDSILERTMSGINYSNFTSIISTLSDPDDKYTFNGNMDEVHIYNRSLNIEELKNLYYFNNIELSMKKGINEISVFGCRLEKENQYNVIAITESGQKIEKVIINK